LGKVGTGTLAGPSSRSGETSEAKAKGKKRREEKAKGKVQKAQGKKSGCGGGSGQVILQAVLEKKRE